MVISQTRLAEALEYIVPQIKEHQDQDPSRKRPFVIGLTGLQGSGKSTWANALCKALEETHGFKVVNVSLDDFYHNHDNLVRVREANLDNPMLRTRGQPGTHDEALAAEFFSSLLEGDGVRVPAFDKSKFNGEGDRVPQSEWRYVSRDPPIDVVLFEGWCVGFQALSEDEVRAKWQQVREKAAQRGSTTSQVQYPIETIGEYDIRHLLTINRNLKVYNETFMGPRNFDFFVHLDTDDLENVYRWRIDQEHAMLRIKGEGMADAQVIAFVKGYMPGYELYLDRLRHENFVKKEGRECHLRVVLDRERTVTVIEPINSQGR